MITERRPGVYRKRSCASFGEWLHTHRVSSRVRWDEIKQATGLSKTTITNREQKLTMPPGELTRKVPIAFIEQICEVLGLDAATREEGFYLGGWTERVQTPDQTMIPVEVLDAVRRIAKTAMEAIQGICDAYEITTTAPSREFSSEDNPLEAVRFR